MAVEPAQSAIPARYRRRRPDKAVLYRVQAHFETYRCRCDEGNWDGSAVPAHVERGFRRYLDYGILARGFARARYAECGHDFLIAYSCKGRTLCPSCNTRRMVETTAHLVDHVFPPLPMHQWVLSLPKRLRYFLRHDRLMVAAVLSDERFQTSGMVVRIISSEVFLMGSFLDFRDPSILKHKVAEIEGVVGIEIRAAFLAEKDSP